jgi:hypothetical protein
VLCCVCKNFSFSNNDIFGSFPNELTKPSMKRWEAAVKKVKAVARKTLLPVTVEYIFWNREIRKLLRYPLASAMEVKSFRKIIQFWTYCTYVYVQEELQISILTKGTQELPEFSKGRKKKKWKYFCGEFSYENNTYLGYWEINLIFKKQGFKACEKMRPPPPPPTPTHTIT